MAQFLNDHIAIAQKFDVERHVREMLAIDQNLRYVRRDRGRNERDWLHFERRTDHDQQITFVFVFGHRIMKIVRQTFMEKHNIWLHLLEKKDE